MAHTNANGPVAIAGSLPHRGSRVARRTAASAREPSALVD